MLGLAGCGREGIQGSTVDARQNGEHSEGDESEAALQISFGLSREPKTRVRHFNLCYYTPRPEGQIPRLTAEAETAVRATSPATATPTKLTYNECIDTGEIPVSTEPQDRPAVVFAGIDQDVIRRGQADNNNEFPASQISVVATNEGRQSLKVSITATPLAPEEVRFGTYEGTFFVERDGDELFAGLFRITLEDRTRPLTVFWVLLALTVGAVGGSAAKYIYDVAAPLAALRRRARSLSRRLRDRRFIPFHARERLNEIHDKLASGDDSAVDDMLKELESPVDDLIEFSNKLEELDAEVGAQVAELQSAPTLSTPRVRAAIARENQVITALTTTKWPWKTPDDVVAARNKAGADFRRLTDAIRTQDPTEMSASLNAILSGSDTTPAIVALERTSLAADLRGTSGSTAPTAKRRLFERFLDYSQWFGVAIAALVVVFAGYLSEYIGKPAFDGGPDSYGALIIWAFGVQLAGTTVATVIGRLTPKPQATKS